MKTNFVSINVTLLSLVSIQISDMFFFCMVVSTFMLLFSGDIYFVLFPFMETLHLISSFAVTNKTLYEKVIIKQFKKFQNKELIINFISNQYI